MAAGGIARKVLGDGISIRAALVQVGDRAIDRDRWDWDQVNENPFFCPDAETAALWEADMDALRRDGSSTGAIVEVVVSGVPATESEALSLPESVRLLLVRHRIGIRIHV